MSLKNNDSILSKLDTYLRRKKNRSEVEELTKESHEAITRSVSPYFLPDPKDYELEEGEEKVYPEMSSHKSPNVLELKEKLITWINNELATQRILVRDLQEDLYDGQVLQKLVEKLTGVTLSHPEVTQSEIGQIQRLNEVIETINGFIRLKPSWTTDLIYQKDLVAILRLLVALANHFRNELHFQPGVFLTVIVARKLKGALQYRYERKYITDVTGPESPSHPSDVLSRDHLVVQTMTSFVNSYLGQLTLRVNNMATDFADGVFLIFLMGLIEGYFVPFHSYHPTPTSEAMRVANVKLAFELMQAAGMSEPPAQPEEIVAADSKAILRVLYNLYSFWERREQTQKYRQSANICELDEREEANMGDVVAGAHSELL